MNSNIFKTVIICLVAGLVVSIAALVVLNISNAIDVTSFTNTQLSNIAKGAFGAGAVVMAGYSLATKRQW